MPAGRRRPLGEPPEGRHGTRPEAELIAHLGYDRHGSAGRGSGNSRNGHGSKTVFTDSSEVALDVARGRNGSFEPQQLAEKRQSRLPDFDEKVTAL